MDELKTFFKTTLIGGLTVILPIALLVFVFTWLFNIITGLIQPFTNVILHTSQLPEIFADLIALTILTMLCFAVGFFVRTRSGSVIHSFIENRILKSAPGYSLIKETILQFIGNKKMPFSQVALVRPFGNDTLQTAFITDTHDDGSYTVFVPTGPNPTSGMIFHLKAENVHVVHVSVEKTMRSIISCGAGSAKLIDELNHQSSLQQKEFPFEEK